MNPEVVKGVLSVLSVGMEVYKDNVKTKKMISLENAQTENKIFLENTQTENKILLDNVKAKNECGKILVAEGTKIGGGVVENIFDIIKSNADENLRERMIRFDQEMEALERDRELQRRMDVLNSVKQYQIEVANVIKESMMILAVLPLDLRERAALMLDEEQDKYREKQRKWQKDAMDDLAEIENRFSGNAKIKERMENMIMDGLNDMIQAAENTLKQMNEDIKNIHENAIKLSEIGAEQMRHQMQPLQRNQTMLIGEKHNRIDKKE